VKLIVGLGNPGPQYELTPHNFGFLAVDRIAEDLGVEVKNRRCRALTGTGNIGGEKVLLAKPETFMNLSGHSVRELLEEFGEREGLDAKKDLIVLHDELAFPLGTLRIAERGSSAGNNGIESVIGAVGEDFVRVRLGVAPEHALERKKEYVLSAWRKKDLDVVGEVLDRCQDAVKMIIAQGVGAAMNQFNRRDVAEAGS
jgi:PTH1 family peptidyl-tRNA hydrolase